MYTIINMLDLTDRILPSSLKIDLSIDQPISQASFRVTDKAASYLIRGLNHIVILDENGLANQTINLLLNPAFDINAGDPTVVWYWPITSTFTTPPAITYTYSPYAANPVQIDVSPTGAAGSYLYQQPILSGHMTPGQTYTLSATIAATGATNAKAVLQMQYIDRNGAVLATFSQTWTSGNTRRSVSGPAPAGSVSAIVSFGVQTTNATNAGQFTFSNLQYEPQLFAARGVSYPTPLCTHWQANCYQLPNGTTVRQTRLYSGFISRSTKTYDALKRRWQVESFSGMKLLDATYVNGIFAAGQTDTQIIQSLLSQAVYAIHPIPGTPLITANNITGGYVMPAMSWDNVTMLQALKDIAAITGCSYYLDPYFDLHYFPWQYNITSFSLSDTPDNVHSFAYSDFQVEEDATQPQNRVIVTGGTYYPTWIDNFTGTGSQTTFTLTQATPQTITSLTVAGVTKKVGIKNTNTFAQGYDALLDTSNAQILFASAPANGAAIVASYSFATPLRTRSWDLASIEQSYGIAFEGKLDDSSLSDTSATFGAGIGQLESFAYGRDIIRLSTQQPIQPGQVVPITSQAEGLSAAPYLIQKVSILPKGAGIVVYSANLGAYDPDLVALLKAAQQSNTTSTLTTLAGEDITFTDTDLLTFSESSSISVHAGSTYTYNNASSLYGYAVYS